MDNENIKSLMWRYATKKFDSSKDISEKDLNEILESLRLSPSSYGLQPWKFLVISDKKILEELRKSAWDQSQITDASYLIVLCTRTDLDEKYIEKYIKSIADTRGTSLESLEGFKNILLNSIKNMSKEQLIEWSKKQVYISLGILLNACAEKRIDSCPMEGFDSKKFDEILGLNKKGLTSTVICTIGYRSKDDTYALHKKVRFDKEDLFEFI